MHAIGGWAASCVVVLASLAVTPTPDAGPLASDLRPYRAADLPPAAGMFLVAGRDLVDPNFQRTVVLIIQHSDAGTTGLIINRGTLVQLAELLPDMEHVQAKTHRIFFGGPVAINQIVMLLRKESENDQIEQVAEGIYFSADRRVLESVVARKKPETDLHFYIGHAGWAPGQLNHELARGDWHVVKADAESVFGGDLDTLWDRLIRKFQPQGLQVRRDQQPVKPVVRA